MNLKPLFEIQRKLDDHIMDEHPELKEQNNLEWKILALQVEIGECANEWRGFKKWSHDQEPRTRVYDKNNSRIDKVVFKNPLLEEYVDGLHFVLSIGLEHKFDEWVDVLAIEDIRYSDIITQFRTLLQSDWEIYEEGDGGYYHEGLELYIGLGKMLGFSWEQIEQAYMEKNAINHQRQNEGY